MTRAVGLRAQDGPAALRAARCRCPTFLIAAGDPRVARALGTRRAPRAASPRTPTPAPSCWPVREPVADVERVAPADLPAVDADLLGEQVEHALEGERRPGWPRSRAWRPTAGCWCRRRGRLDVHVRDAVGAAGVAGGPLQDLAADAGVGAVVADDPRPDGDEAALGVAADGVVEPHRVALDVEPQALARG